MLFRSSDNDSSIFDKQAGDILILSGDILEAIYGSMYNWIDCESPERVNNNHLIILKGFNLYLSRKNKKLLYM